MICNVVIIRFSDTVLIGIREEFHLLFLHFTSNNMHEVDVANLYK